MTVVFVIYCNAASIYVHMSVMYTNHVAHVQVYIYIYPTISHDRSNLRLAGNEEEGC